MRHSTADLVRCFIAFLKRAYARGKELEREQEERQRARKLEIRAARRARWTRRREAARAHLNAVSFLRGAGLIFCFVCRWSWRIACLTLWLSLTHLLHKHHSTGFGLIGWGMFTVGICSLGAGVGILVRAFTSEIGVEVVETLLDYRRWKREHRQPV